MKQNNEKPLSKVEVKGFEARYYDWLMNLVTAGTYPFFIRNAIQEMQIKPGDEILVFGSGTGRNICLMNRYLDGKGRVVGLDIGDEMLRQAYKRCHNFSYVSFEKKRIDEPLPYSGVFDKVFISFVLHGFIQEDREKIIENAYKALKPGGEFVILDYNEFDLTTAPWLVRLAFKAECPLATDFVGRDLEAVLRKCGFDSFRKHRHYLGYVRLLGAHKA